MCLESLSAQSFHADLSSDSLVIQDNQNFQIAFHNETRILSGNPDSVKVSLSNILFSPLEQPNFPAKDLPTAPEWKYQKGLSAKKTVVTLSVFPLFIDASGKVQRIQSFDYRIESFTSPKPQKAGEYYAASKSVLAKGKWYKWGVTASGIYKIDYSAIKNAGIDLSSISSLNNIKIHSRGGKMLPYPNSESRYDDLPELAVKRVDNGNNIFDDGDYILFYAEGPHLWKYNGSYTHDYNLYTDSVFYFLTINADSPKAFNDQAESALPYTKEVNAFDENLFHEQDEANLLGSGRLWLGNHFLGSGKQDFRFVFQEVESSSNITVNAQLYAKSMNNNGTDFLVSAGSGSSSANIPKISGNSTDDIAKSKSIIFSFSPTKDTIEVEVQMTAYDAFGEGWINFIEATGRRKLIYKGSPLFFRDQLSVGSGNVAHYKITGTNGGLQLWDISDFTTARAQLFTFSGDSMVFNAATDSLREFVVFNPLDAATPGYCGEIKNQNLHALSPAQLIIVTHSDFRSEAKRLADFHQNIDSLSVLVVDINEIYNEFSGGVEDIVALRDFMKMLYDKASGPTELPKYLLLFGDGTYDYKNILKGSRNFIPTYQSVNSMKNTASYTSDDFFGLLDDSEGNWGTYDPDLLDLGIGRFPVKTPEDAKIVVDKVFAYCNYFDGSNTYLKQEQSQVFGPWRNEALFVADDEDFNIHLHQANQLAVKMENEQPQYNVDKIYIDAYKQTSSTAGDRYPEANEAWTKRINEGLFLVNYTGHGGEDGLTGEAVFETSDIIALNNGVKMPLFVTATCEFSRYDLPDRSSAGELLFLNPKGGAIALLSTVRLVFSTPNFNLNKTFYNVAFSQPQGYKTRLGDIFKATKVTNNGGTNDRNFTLLGDPALSMAFPRYKITVDKVSSAYDNSVTDTMKALMKVKIEGRVTDANGTKLTTYNGKIYPRIIDQPVDYNTLANDGSNSPYSFTLQQNTIFKGSASVIQGAFSFEFMVPKDIAAAYGNGKISLYAENGAGIDAAGNNKTIIIGGTFDNAAADASGPELSIYMNDSSFMSGDITDASPLMIIDISDSSGINLMSGDIGHEMSAILDNNTGKVIALSTHYEAALNNYQKGKIEYRLEDLSEGRHTVEAKVWDTYNNSSRAYTEFIVSTDANTALEHVLNYPNPFTTRTGFYFEHNQVGKNLEVTLQIFTVSGKLIKTINEAVYADEKRVGPIEWDGLDDYGDAIGRGVYIYKIKVKSDNGTSDNVLEKLVILK
ncbi:MAG: type IX secretion system sortase PorU [Flavobacteriales bacterium]